MLHLGGENVRLADCFWVRFAPTGCAYGSLLGDRAVNEEQAHTELVPRQRDRDRDERQGYRIELLTRQQWRAQAKPCFMGECTHREAS
jgi:hypothetical protein